MPLVFSSASLVSLSAPPPHATVSLVERACSSTRTIWPDESSPRYLFTMTGNQQEIKFGILSS